MTDSTNDQFEPSRSVAFFVTVVALGAAFAILQLLDLPEWALFGAGALSGLAAMTVVNVLWHYRFGELAFEFSEPEYSTLDHAHEETDD